MDAVLFDLGNTLFNYLDFSMPAYAVRLRKSMATIVAELRRQGMLDDDFDLTAYSQKVFDEILDLDRRAIREHFEFDLSAEALKILRRQWPEMDGEWDRIINDAIYGVMRAEYTAHPEALAMLDELRAMGLKTGLISNTQFRRAGTMEDLEKIGFAQRLDTIVFSIDIMIRKPRPEIFKAALEPLNTPPERAVMVGDTIEADIDGAKALGMKTILIETPANKPRVEKGDTGADWVIRTLSEIPPILRDVKLTA